MHSAITAFIGLRPLIAGPPFIEFRVRESVAAGAPCYATPGRISTPLPPGDISPPRPSGFPCRLPAMAALAKRLQVVQAVRPIASKPILSIREDVTRFRHPAFSSLASPI